MYFKNINKNMRCNEHKMQHTFKVGRIQVGLVFLLESFQNAFEHRLEYFGNLFF